MCLVAWAKRSENAQPGNYANREKGPATEIGYDTPEVKGLANCIGLSMLLSEHRCDETNQVKK